MNGAMRVLLTGATGQVGNAVARRLHDRGDEVVALVRNPVRARGLLPDGISLAQGDVTDPGSLRLAAAGAEAAVNCMGVFEQWAAEPDLFNRVNAGGARNVVTAAREAGARRVVHTSTFDVFHADRGGTVSEAHLAGYEKGTSYERSKQLAERLVLEEAGTDGGIEVVLVNPAGIIGPGAWAEAGLNASIADALRGRLPLCPPGGMSLTWVDDAADAHVAALDRGRPGERYIVAGGYASLREIFAIAVDEAGRGRVPKVIPERWARRLADAGEAVSSVIGKAPLLPVGQLEFLLWEARADSSKVRDELGIGPLDAEEAIRRTARWLVEERRA